MSKTCPKTPTSRWKKEFTAVRNRRKANLFPIKNRGWGLGRVILLRETQLFPQGSTWRFLSSSCPPRTKILSEELITSWTSQMGTKKGDKIFLTTSLSLSEIYKATDQNLSWRACENLGRVLLDSTKGLRRTINSEKALQIDSKLLTKPWILFRPRICPVSISILTLVRVRKLKVELLII